MGMYVVLLGAPGAGKGTQAATITEQLNLKHIATGDLFRQAIEKGTALGKKAQEYMTKGLLVPDEVTIGMVLERIAQPDCREGVVFDGFPRNLKQAEALDKAMEAQGKAIDKAVYIKVTEKELFKRLAGRWICRNCQTPYHAVSSPPKVARKCDKCGGELYQRADDTDKTIKERLQVYFTQTAPLIDYYQRTVKLIEIDGEGDPAEIGKRIIAGLRKGIK
jgi:adenylate kinase